MDTGGASLEFVILLFNINESYNAEVINIFYSMKKSQIPHSKLTGDLTQNHIKVYTGVGLCIFILSGCGILDNAKKPKDEISQPAMEQTATPENTSAATALNETPESAQLEDNKDTIHMKNLNSDKKVIWTAKQIKAAKQAALAYYKGTVFSVNTIEYTEEKLPYEAGVNECNFTVNVSKDGVVQEPDRTITLQLDNNTWKVVNEGY